MRGEGLGVDQMGGRFLIEVAAEAVHGGLQARLEPLLLRHTDFARPSILKPGEDDEKS